jgi:hypothetical protein
MDAAREKWTDERRDDLFERIDRRLDKLVWLMTSTLITGFLTLAGLIVSQG